jgi:hypothetical protein
MTGDAPKIRNADRKVRPNPLRPEDAMRHARLLLPTCLLLTASAACAGDADPAGPDDGSVEAYLEARFDGVAWAAVPSTILAAGTAPGRPGGIAFQGSTSAGVARTLAVHLGRIPGPGSYPLGVNLNSATGGIATVVSGATSWSTPLSGAAGVVEITALSESWVSGTFRFEGSAVGPGTTPATISATEGRFRVPRNADYVAPSADQLGSHVSASIGGTPWNAATVVGSGGGQGTVTFNASNTAYSLTVIVGPITGPGTGPLSSTVPVRRITVQRIGGAGGWGGTAADQGTLTITTLSATRVAGSFSGTLAPSAAFPGASPLVISGASFDVRIAP